MLKDGALIFAWVGFAIYFAGYVSSGVVAYRLKKWGWLFALLFVGPISYPFFAIINHRAASGVFKIFCLGIILVLVGIGGLFAARPVGTF